MPLCRRLAAAQTVPVAGDVPANIAQHVRLALRAADALADVVVFPELSLTGYELELAPALAFEEDDARLAPLIEVARRRGLTLIVGAPVCTSAGLHIGAFLIGPAAPPVLHTKRHLSRFDSCANGGGPVPPAEDSIFTPGTLSPSLDLGDHKAVVAVCAESFQRWVMKDAVDRGAQTYLTSHFSLPADRAARISGLGKFAAHTRMAVVFANYGGPSGGLSASGGSAILAPSGELLCELGQHGTGLAVAREHESGWNTECVRVEER